jgi:hypothetical protein
MSSPFTRFGFAASDCPFHRGRQKGMSSGRLSAVSLGDSMSGWGGGYHIILRLAKPPFWRSLY